MVNLREPGLGPVVGHTTDTTCRIWVRAADPADDRGDLDENRRTVGVIGIVQNKKVVNAWYFRLNREFDRTGTFVIGSDVQLGFYPDDFEEQGKAVPDELTKGVPSPPLTPDTAYTIRVGIFTIDDPTPNSLRTRDWELIKLLPKISVVKDDLMNLDGRKCEASFRTFTTSGTTAASMAFLLGSCRYPGLLWKIKEADQIFRPMVDHFVANGKFSEPARFTMMCGDQIYADMLNRFVPLLRADRYDEFQERYVTAYSAQNLHTLLRSATTYMILDDHEIEDNWTQDRLKDDQGKHLVFNFAVTAYMNYQWSHSPRTWGRLLYYKFECGGYPFFVLDTRTQRFKNNNDRTQDRGLRDNHMLGHPTIDEHHPGQMKRLLDWLVEQQDRGDVPKFIVSSSVFAPNAMDERIEDAEKAGIDQLLFEVNKENRDDSDSWPAFPVTRKTLLEWIVDKNIQNVVFLSGDIHCSNVAEITFEKDEGNKTRQLPLKAFSVTSSAFYWPFPFADGDPNGYVHDSRDPQQWDPFPLKDGKTRMHYTSSAYTQEDNFARLEIDKAKATLTVRVFDRDGKPVENKDARGNKVSLVSELKLQPWT